MKRIKVLMAMLLCMATIAGAQVPQKFQYQAVLRHTDGTVMGNASVVMTISLIKEKPDGDVLYSETHKVKTSPDGLISIAIGGGEKIAGEFGYANWDKPVFLNVKVSNNGAEQVDLGSTQILAVPYAIHAHQATFADSARYATDAVTAERLAPGGVVTITAEAGHNADEPIFSVKNPNGDLVFAVFEDGVRSYVKDMGDDSQGGFVVGELEPHHPEAKAAVNNQLLVVTPDSTRIYLNAQAQTKSVRTGFAVGTRSGRKGVTEDLLVVTPNSTDIYIDDTRSAKGVRTGFAVGTRSGRKANETSTLLSVTPVLTEVNFDQRGAKGVRTGFAVGTRSGRKGPADDLLLVTTDSTRIYIDDNPQTKSVRTGFAVGGRSGRKSAGLNYLTVTPDSTRVVVGSTSASHDPNRGFTVGGLDSKGQYTNFLRVTDSASNFNTSIHAQGDLMISGQVNQNVGIAQEPLVIGQDSYNTVKIGRQVWMAQNRKATTSDDNHYNSTTYGGYFGYNVINETGMCPDGWRLPQQVDFDLLFRGQGGAPDASGNFVGISDKLISGDDWAMTPKPGNLSGFSAIASKQVTKDGSIFAESERDPIGTTFWYGNGFVTINKDKITFSTETTGYHHIRCIKVE